MNEQLSLFLKDHRHSIIKSVKQYFYENHSSELLGRCAHELLKASFEITKRRRRPNHDLTYYYASLGLLLEASLKYKIGNEDEFWGDLIDHLPYEGNTRYFDPNRDVNDNKRNIAKTLDYRLDKEFSLHKLLELFKGLQTQENVEDSFTEDEIKHLSNVKSKRNSAVHANSKIDDFQLDFDYEKERQHLSMLARIALNLTDRQLEQLILVTEETLEAQLSSEKESLLEKRWITVIQRSKRSKKHIESSLREHLKDVLGAMTEELTPAMSTRSPAFFTIRSTLFIFFLVVSALVFISIRDVESPQATKVSMSSSEKNSQTLLSPDEVSKGSCSYFINGVLSNIPNVKHASFDDLARIDLESAPHEYYCKDLKDQFNKLKEFYNLRVHSFKELQALAVENPISSKLVTLDLKNKEYVFVHRLEYLGQKKLDRLAQCKQVGEQVGELSISVVKYSSLWGNLKSKISNLWWHALEHQETHDELSLSANGVDVKIKLINSDQAHKESLPIEFAVLPSKARLISEDGTVNECGGFVGDINQQMNTLKTCQVEMKVNHLEKIKSLQSACEGLFR